MSTIGYLRSDNNLECTAGTMNDGKSMMSWIYLTRGHQTLSDQRVNHRMNFIQYSFFPVKQVIIKKLGIEVGYTPFVSTREHLTQYAPTSLDQLPPRSMQDSFTSAIIPLTTDKILKDKYVGFMGNVRLGRLMEDMDMFAGK